MADPFDVRIRFSSQLQHLNASVMSAQKAAQFAVKNKEMCEDLHSCILEQLQKSSTSMNTRANIIYFVDTFLDVASKERADVYVRLVQRDIVQIVDAVCPSDGSGAANLKVVCKVLQSLSNKGFVLEQTVSEIRGSLESRTVSAGIGFSSPANGDTSNGDKHGTMDPSRKRQIEQRLEEDRERHKKQRENDWVAPRNAEDEMWDLYENTSEIGVDDHILWEEELMQHRRTLRPKACSHVMETVKRMLDLDDHIDIDRASGTVNGINNGNGYGKSNGYGTPSHKKAVHEVG